MRKRNIAIAAGAVAVAKLTVLKHRGDGAHGHRHVSPCQANHGTNAYLEHSEWRGLTSEEAKRKLHDRHGGDTAAVESAIAYLDERGYLARAAETVND